MQWTEDQLATMCEEHEAWLLQHTFIVGTAIGYDDQGQLAIKILTDSANAQQRELVMNHLKELPVLFEETGLIEAL